MLQQLELRASNAVRAALAGTGRTEDVRFSPDNRRLIVAGFGLNRLLILAIAIEPGASGLHVVVDDFMELTSDGITYAHGVDFIDDRTLAVANRDGLVSIIGLPSGELGGRQEHVEAIREISGGLFCRLKSPGSVVARREPRGRVSLLVCNNYIHRVTRHVVDPATGFRVKKNGVLLERSLNIPDGIAISHDGQWIAVSNHGTNEVKLFDASAPLGPYTVPAGVLTDVGFPHGLRFTPDDRHLLVADAGAPLVHVCERGAGWAGSRGPTSSAAVLDDETFKRGRANPEEGGPKGIDIDRTGKVMAATCEEQTLAFFSLAAVTGARKPLDD